MIFCFSFTFFFFFNDTATTEIYTLSLHDALPISRGQPCMCWFPPAFAIALDRSEEHTSELQSRENLVCRLLLEKKKINDLEEHHTAEISELRLVLVEHGPA